MRVRVTVRYEFRFSNLGCGQRGVGQRALQILTAVANEPLMEMRKRRTTTPLIAHSRLMIVCQLNGFVTPVFVL